MDQGIDQLAAAITGAILILVAIGLGVRLQEDAVGETVTVADRARTIAVSDLLDRDIRNLGALRPPSTPPVLSWTTSGGVTTASYYTVDDTGASTVISYQPVPADTLYEEGGGSRIVYSLQRTVGAGSPTDTGAMFTRFELTLLDASGAVVGPPYDDVRQVGIVLESPLELGPLTGRTDNHIVATPNAAL